jgi:hypothetical protein
MFIGILIFILIGIAFITIWYIKRIIVSDQISVYQAWVTSWTLNFILFSYYIVSAIFNINDPQFNILAQSVTVVILITFLQIGVLLKVNSYDIEMWTPTVLKLIGPIKGVVTSLFLGIPALLPMIPLYSAPDSIQAVTSCGYIDFDIYYEIVCSILLLLALWCINNKKPQGYIRLSILLYLIGWLMELTSSILPSHPDWLYLVSWILTAIALPLSILGIILVQKTPFSQRY